MKKPEQRSFIIGTHEGGILSLTPTGRTSIGCKTEEAPIEAVYSWMARRRRRENPAPDGKRKPRRKLFTSSEELRKWQREYPEELPTSVIHVRDMQEGDVYIGRRNARYGLPESIWHNPFKVGKDGTREEVIAKFEAYLLASPELLAQIPTLRGKRLACWCAPKLCHGEILIRLAEAAFQMKEAGEQVTKGLLFAKAGFGERWNDDGV